jgi:pyruvate/2-oxoglutarate dehydrogenase complex dihydrolipoamide dehydrogenase (E3) component
MQWSKKYDSIFLAKKNNPLFKIYNHTYSHAITNGKLHSYYAHPDSVWLDIEKNKAFLGFTSIPQSEFGKDNINIGNFPLSANGKALALGDYNGFIKTIFHKKTGELLGAHMIGVEVTEMIYGLVLTKQLEGTELDLMNTIFPHPTISEAIHESVLNAFGKSIHI